MDREREETQDESQTRVGFHPELPRTGTRIYGLSNSTKGRGKELKMTEEQKRA